MRLGLTWHHCTLRNVTPPPELDFARLGSAPGHKSNIHPPHSCISVDDRNARPPPAQQPSLSVNLASTLSAYRSPCVRLQRWVPKEKTSQNTAVGPKVDVPMIKIKIKRGGTSFLFTRFELIFAGFLSRLISPQVDVIACWRGRTAERVTCTETCRRRRVRGVYFCLSFLCEIVRFKSVWNGERGCAFHLISHFWGSGFEVKWNGSSLPGGNFEAGERTLWEEAILCDDRREERVRINK